ncbi:MAG: nucleoside triphosphate pyrophosphohydrolase, partial [Pelosinus sp.]|nr:nucleoside triphosphate pyrophosphohydrolase [Pelosinus sp.]
DKLQSAETLLLRTAKHPTVAGLQARNISFTTYDYLYEEKASFEEVYSAIAADCIARAEAGEQVVYAVPGSPLVAEKTVLLIRELAIKESIPVKILPGMSFLETLYARLAIDPIEGITILDAADLERLLPEVNTALIVTQVYNRQVASDTKLALMQHCADDWQIILVRNVGLPDEDIREIPLFELDRTEVIDHLTSVYVPACKERIAPFELKPLQDIMATLRSPGGCVWDMEQTHTSLRRYFVEEVYEVLEAIDLEDSEKLCEELGDLLLQVVFHARVAEESGIFSMQDVINGVSEKMVRRHPHVFGGLTVRDAAEVVVNWEAIKKQEKAGERKRILDGIPKGLPALLRAYKLQGKAAKVGFDWDDVQPVWDKVQEELVELREAAAADNLRDIEGELGDVLFSVVNLARFLGVEAETALNVTNNKFIRRFQYIENKVMQQGLKWDKLTLEELDRIWNKAKQAELREKC